MKKKRLTKGKDKILEGVCSGIAEYFDLDVTLVRLIYILLVLINPVIFILFYIIAAIIMPESDGSKSDINTWLLILIIILILLAFIGYFMFILTILK